METPKILTLDYSKWRCGSSSKIKNNRTGKGVTSLLNKKMYMCCLGQFSLQCGLTKKDILNVDMPDGIRTYTGGIGIFTDFVSTMRYVLNSEVAETLASINDAAHTSVTEKIASIRAVLKANNIKLRVINRPKK